MDKMIKDYIEKMQLTDINSFAIKNNIYLSKNELLFTFNFIKTNYQEILRTKKINIELYKDKFSEENYPKIKNLITKYQNYL